MSIHPEVSIGHIHLTVSDLDRALLFYRDLLGFEITARYGDSAVFLSAGGYHHHIALNTWVRKGLGPVPQDLEHSVTGKRKVYSSCKEGKGATPPPAGHTGLYHAAILYPNRKELAKVLKRLIDDQYPLVGTADHGVSEAIYLDAQNEQGKGVGEKSSFPRGGEQRARRTPRTEWFSEIRHNERLHHYV